MVKTTTITQSNAAYASEHHTGLVCVFAGATTGIGSGTLEQVARMLDAPTLYILGRSAARFAEQRAKLERLNPRCTIVFLEAEVSLLQEVDAACEKIVAAENKVDWLYMSQGYYPLNGPQYTKEGLETCFALSYYSRMRLVSNLLPLLQRSSQPRVLSVLAGGKEKPMLEHDLGLERQWTSAAVMNHTTTMTSLAFEHLAHHAEGVTFLHAFPGLVRTDIFARQTSNTQHGLLWRLALVGIHYLVAVAMLILGISVEDSGARQAFHLSSESFRPGASRVTESSEPVTTRAVLDECGSRGMPEQVWEHTLRVFEKTLAHGSQ